MASVRPCSGELLTREHFRDNVVLTVVSLAELLEALLPGQRGCAVDVVL